MRRLLAIVLVLMMAIVPTVLAEEQTTTDDVALVTQDFGDFSMTFPEDIVGAVVERENNQPFLQMYWDYDETKPFNMNLNCSWSETYSNVTAGDPNQTAQLVLEQVVGQFEQMQIAVANPAVLAAAVDEQDGKPALVYVFSMDLDLTGAGVDQKYTLYTMQAVVSDEAFGTYTFTISTDDLAAAEPLMDITNTVTWNK